MTLEHSIDNYKLNYRSIIPLYILLDKDLSKNEIALYGLIEQMESCAGSAFFSNRKIANILGVSHDSKIVNAMARRLITKGYIKKEYKTVQIKDIRTTKLCWSVCKRGFIFVEDDVDDTPDQEPRGVAEVHPPRVAEVHPYNTNNNKTTHTNNARGKSQEKKPPPEYDEDVCVLFANANGNVPKSELIQMFNKHGFEYVNQKIKFIKEKKNVDDFTAMLKSAVRNNWWNTSNPKPQPQQRVEKPSEHIEKGEPVVTAQPKDSDERLSEEEKVPSTSEWINSDAKSSMVKSEKERQVKSIRRRLRETFNLGCPYMKGGAAVKLFEDKEKRLTKFLIVGDDEGANIFAQLWMEGKLEQQGSVETSRENTG